MLPAAAQAPDADRVLAGMREAIGGQAIASLQGFSVTGTESKNLGVSMARRDSEWVYAAPDRFIHVSSGGGGRTDTIGFNGNGLVYLRGSGGTGRGGPPLPDRQPPPMNLDAAVTANKQAFARFVLPLLGITPVYPFTATYVGEDTVAGRPAHVLALKDSAGGELRFYTDAVTHLPAMLSWMAKPEVLRWPEREDREAPRPPPGGIVVTGKPVGDPTAGMPLVEHRVYYSDFTVIDGLKWPRRMKEVVADDVLLDIRLDSFKINPPVEPYRFVTVPRDR